MAAVSFYLKSRKTQDKEQLIMFLFQHKGERLKQTTQLRVTQSGWDQKNQRVRPHVAGAALMNTRLSKLRESVMQLVLKAKVEEQEPTVEWLRETLDKTPKAQPKEKTVLEVLDEFIEAHKLTHSHEFIQKYQTVRGNLTEFEEKQNQTLYFGGMATAFFAQYTDFLIGEKKNTNNTVAKKLAFLKTFLSWTVSHKIQSGKEYADVKTIRSKKAQHIALSEEELKMLYTIDLRDNERLEKVRDVFCFGCFTGLRYSDIENLKPENITDAQTEKGTSKALKIHIQKTREFLILPLSTPALAILERYNYCLPVITNQKTNAYLKELGRLANIDKPVERVVFRGSERIATTQPKYELITTHTARRTFATLSAIRGMTLITLQRILGHSNIQQTMDYIKDTDNAKAAEMARVWG